MKTESVWTEASRPIDPKYVVEKNDDGRTVTTIKAYAIVERLNSMFGPCGRGWGTKNLSFHVCHGTRTYRDGNERSVVEVACNGTFWYRTDDGVCEFDSVGVAEVLLGDIGEGYKKAATNLISKASSFIGVGFDIYSGEHDRNGSTRGGGGTSAPNPTPAAPSSAGEHVHTGTPLKLEVVNGEKDGRQWTRYDLFIEGFNDKIVTFSESDAGTFNSAVERDEQVTVTYESTRSGRFTNHKLKSIAIQTRPAGGAAPKTSSFDVTVSDVQNKPWQGKTLYGITTNQGLFLTLDAQLSAKCISAQANGATLVFTAHQDGDKWWLDAVTPAEGVPAAAGGIHSDDIPF